MRVNPGYWMLALVLLSAGCATPAPHDYTAYKQSRPASILVLPPVNQTTDIKASIGMLSQMTEPLAEAGYYVFPVAVVSETFKHNGVTEPTEIHNVAPAKLRETFGADAALYVTVKEYGARYTVFNSAATVSAEAKLLDLKTGDLLWKGSARASSDESNNQSGGGLIGMMVAAAIQQISNQLSDRSQQVAGVTSQRLLGAGQTNGVLYGPRSPRYGSD